MSRTVIICEKPSQARNLRAALGDRHGRILAAQGHLLRLEEPEEVNAAWGAWGFDVLRPAEGRYGWRPDEGDGKRERLQEIGKALSSADRVIIATDCDREGQAIGESILRHLGFGGEVLRALFTAEDEISLTRAFAALKPNGELRPLYEAAVARAQADQIFNLTLTRAATVRLRPDGWRGALGIGRVKTPTLGLACARETEIRDFHPIDFFEVAVIVAGDAGRATLWHRPRGEARIFDAAKADRIALAASSYAGPLSVTRKAKASVPPRPFDLPTLQKHAGKWGWTATQTGDVAQALYERHKLITYPRAENRYLPENLIPSAGALLDKLRTVEALAALAPAAPVIRTGKAGLWSDAGIAGASHHAMIPNINVSDMAAGVAALDADERRLFDAIALAFLAAVSPDHEFDETCLSFCVHIDGDLLEGDTQADAAEKIDFLAIGRVVTRDGWKAVLSDDAEQEEEPDDGCGGLPSFNDGDAVVCDMVRAHPRKTTVPKRFTEGDLIEAMQNAWKFVEDQVERERLKDAKGIGTPATRDSVIEGLKRQGLLTTNGKHLAPSDLAMWFYSVLCDHAPELVDPGATARMEARLDDVLGGSADADTVINEIAELTGRLVAHLREASPQGTPAFKRPPSAALLAAAKAKAKRDGKRLPKGASEDAQICRDYLGPRRDPADGPSEKQLAYARKLAAETGAELPADAERDAAALSKWIDQARAGSGRDLASSKQREWIVKLVDGGAKAPRGYPDRISATDAKTFLDREFGKKASKNRNL
ncbi:DNA topoisomerase [Xanthobacter sp. V13C-7B]|uniref:DNA topoisomerase n=1 Tax=Xanthobacter variabilis TaxID=3119932 RepID=UPI003727789E